MANSNNETSGGIKEVESVEAKDFNTANVRRCRKCGCTQDDCRQCIEKTGSPCHWVEEDLCSACVEEPGIAVVDTGASQTEASRSDFSGEATNFFSQLASSGNTNFTLRVVSVNDQLTVGVFPGPRNKGLIPANITGTAQELDQKFFTEFIGQCKEKMVAPPAPKEEPPKPKPKAAKKPTGSKDKKRPAPVKKEKHPKPQQKAKPKPAPKTKEKKSVPEKVERPVPTLFEL